jgi:2-iminobutanoate/2-iminopropanoate deaminase
MAKRQIIAGDDIPSHPQPFPTAVRVGNMIFSSAVGGHDPATREAPDGKEAQIAQAFANVRKIVETGGGTVGDISKMVVYLKDKKDRELVNAEWIKMFPDENDRPVRHTVAAELPGKLVIQLEFIAVV